MKQLIEEKCTFEDRDWLIFNLVGSSHCPIKDIRVLKWDMSLPEVMQLREYVDIMESTEMAINKDHEVKTKQ